jgi:hypothetical protein
LSNSISFICKKFPILRFRLPIHRGEFGTGCLGLYVCLVWWRDIPLIDLL